MLNGKLYKTRIKFSQQFRISSFSTKLYSIFPLIFLSPAHNKSNFTTGLTHFTETYGNIRFPLGILYIETQLINLGGRRPDW